MFFDGTCKHHLHKGDHIHYSNGIRVMDMITYKGDHIHYSNGIRVIDMITFVSIVTQDMIDS